MPFIEFHYFSVAPPHDGPPICSHPGTGSRASSLSRAFHAAPTLRRKERGGGRDVGHDACTGKSYDSTLNGAERGVEQSDEKLGARVEVVAATEAPRPAAVTLRLAAPRPAGAVPRLAALPRSTASRSAVARAPHLAKATGRRVAASPCLAKAAGGHATVVVAEATVPRRARPAGRPVGNNVSAAAAPRLVRLPGGLVAAVAAAAATSYRVSLAGGPPAAVAAAAFAPWRPISAGGAAAVHAAAVAVAAGPRRASPARRRVSRSHGRGSKFESLC